MADELDVVDFFLQNAGSSENLFVQDDASADKNTQQADVYDCGKVLQQLVAKFEDDEWDFKPSTSQHIANISKQLSQTKQKRGKKF